MYQDWDEKNERRMANGEMVKKVIYGERRTANGETNPSPGM
jgi:hypothetical protein